MGEFQWTKFTWKLLLELKRYWSKVRLFWNAWAIGFQMVKLKNLSCTKIIVLGGTLLKSVSAVGFLEKKVLGKFLFSPWNVLCDNFFTSPTHLYCQCDDFHTKNFDKHVQDQFLKPVKDHPCDKFGYVEKIMPCFFFEKEVKKI